MEYIRARKNFTQDSMVVGLMTGSLLSGFYVFYILLLSHWTTPELPFITELFLNIIHNYLFDVYLMIFVITTVMIPAFFDIRTVRIDVRSSIILVTCLHIQSMCIMYDIIYKLENINRDDIRNNITNMYKNIYGLAFPDWESLHVALNFSLHQMMALVIFISAILFIILSAFIIGSYINVD